MFFFLVRVGHCSRTRKRRQTKQQRQTFSLFGTNEKLTNLRAGLYHSRRSLSEGKILSQIASAETNNARRKRSAELLTRLWFRTACNFIQPHRKLRNCHFPLTTSQNIKKTLRLFNETFGFEVVAPLIVRHGRGADKRKLSRHIQTKTN